MKKISLVSLLMLALVMSPVISYASIIAGQERTYGFTVYSHTSITVTYTAPSDAYILGVNGETGGFGASVLDYPGFRIYADGVLVYDNIGNCAEFTVAGFPCKQIQIVTYPHGEGGELIGLITLGYDVADNATVIQARDAANAAKVSANNASLYAQQAKTSADNASVRAWYKGTYGGTQQSVADVAGYMANNQLPSISSKIDNINTTINNLSGDKTPPIPVLKTMSGAMATSGGSIQAVLDITDYGGTTFTYSLDNMTYSPVPADKIITLPVRSPGTNVISVWVMDSDGNVGTTSIAIRKL